MKSGIIIIGPSGSGKTTLGKKLAEVLGYPFFDVDEFIWRFDTPELYTVMYSREEKISRLQDAIAPYEHFVMAGSMSSFHEYFDKYFAMMVLLYAEPEIRVERVKKREVQRFGNRVAEGGDMYESNLQFLDDNRRYEEDGSPNLKEQREWMNSLSCIRLELDGTKSIDENIIVVTKAWNKRQFDHLAKELQENYIAHQKDTDIISEEEQDDIEYARGNQGYKTKVDKM